MSSSSFRRPLRAALTTVSALALTLDATPLAAGQSLDLAGSSLSPAGTVRVDPAPGTEPTPQDIAQVSAEYQQVVADVYAGTNRERAAVGAPAVRVNAKLQNIAQAWSDRQAADDRMYHNPQINDLMNSTFPGRWRVFGENVLQNWKGVSGDQLVRQWMNSPPHKANLLNPVHTDLGVGVAVAPSGKLYSTQNFARLVG